MDQMNRINCDQIMRVSVCIMSGILKCLTNDWFSAISGGFHKVKEFWIPRIKFVIEKCTHPFTRTQFPIRLAYAMTINKTQGQTLKKVGIYLPRSVFAHGQLYVAFSRVGRPEHVTCFIKQTATQGFFKKYNAWFTRNVVWKELF